MNVPAIIEKMEVVDILRSSALIVGFLAVAFGSRNKRTSAANWMVVDAIASSAFGAGFLIFPQNVLGYMVTGKLDALHILSTRLFGVTLLSRACTSAQFMSSNNKSQRVLTQAIELMVLVLTMVMAQMRSQKDGKQKFNDQHMTFGILGAGLWGLGALITVIRSNDLGVADSRGFSLRSLPDVLAFVDMMWLVLVAFVYYGFPMYPLSFTGLVKGIKIDLVHLHMFRTLAVMMLGVFLNYLSVFLSGDARDRHTLISGRLSGALMATLLVWFTTWEGKVFADSPAQYIALAFNSLVAVLLLTAYYAGYKRKAS